MSTLLLHLLRFLPFLCGGHRQLDLENLALRQQLALYKRTVTRPPLRWQRRRFHESLDLGADGRATSGRVAGEPVPVLVTRMAAFLGVRRACAGLIFAG
jgi:hypothetical protein